MTKTKGKSDHNSEWLLEAFRVSLFKVLLVKKIEKKVKKSKIKTNWLQRPFASVILSRTQGDLPNYENFRKFLKFLLQTYQFFCRIFQIM